MMIIIHDNLKIIISGCEEDEEDDRGGINIECNVGRRWASESVGGNRCPDCSRAGSREVRGVLGRGRGCNYEGFDTTRSGHYGRLGWGNSLHYGMGQNLG